LNNNNPDLSQNLCEPLAAAEDFEHPVETRKNSRMAFYIAFLALFFTAVGITVGYKHWLRIDDKAESALAEIKVIKQQLSQTAKKHNVEALSASLTQSSNDAEQRLNDSLIELDQIREQTNYSAQSVTDQIAELTRQQSQLNNNPKQDNHKPTYAVHLIQLAEVRFLLESAKHRFTIHYDKDPALHFLKAADQLLIQISSPQLLTVREKLKADISTLEQFSAPNVKLVSAHIRELDQSIQPLATLEKELTNGESLAIFKEVDDNSITGKVKQYINDSVSIRKQTTLPRYAPNSNDKKRIDQLLRLRLESLRLMTLQHYDEEFHQQIKSIKQLLELYYSVTDSTPWLAALDKMDAENISPQHPNISTALDTLLNMHLTTSNTSQQHAIKPTPTKTKDNQ